MRASQRAETLTLVASSPLPTRQVLARLGLAKSTYYRWRKRQGEGRLEDRRGGTIRPWNTLRPQEEATILARAREQPKLSPGQLAWGITDTELSWPRMCVRSTTVPFAVADRPVVPRHSCLPPGNRGRHSPECSRSAQWPGVRPVCLSYSEQLEEPD